MKKFNWTPVILLVAGAILGGIIRRIFLRIFRKKEQPSVEVAPSVQLPAVEVKEEKKEQTSPIGFQPENIVNKEDNDSVKVEEAL